VHGKLLENPMKKKTLDLYNISKDQSSKLGSPKIKGLENLTNYIK
jgi:hypothetical protein